MQRSERIMSSDKIGGSPNNWEHVIQELMKGQEFATELKALLQETKSKNHKQDSATGEIIKEVMSTISRALAALDAGAILKTDGESKKIRSGQKGGYRRRRSHPYSCTSTKSKTLNDGHPWRKYGQKAIYNAKYSRSYFRCTHKYDQGCVATRQVQQSEEDPSLFLITYFGEHTCRDPAEVISSCLEGDSCIINFASNENEECFQQPQLSSFLKQECSEVVVSNHSTPGSSASGCFGAPELGTLDCYDQLVAEFGRATEQSDVTSGLMQSFGDLSWDFIDNSFEFNDLLSFGDDELLRGC